MIVGKAEELVFPRSEMQVAEILKQANNRKIHVTVSGAGTGITGSRVPPDGLILSAEKMILLDSEQSFPGELIEHSEMGRKFSIFVGKDEETGDYYAIAPVGITIETFKKIVAARGLYYPPDPTEMTALLGGTVATNASGARTFRYGPTRDYVRRIRVVLPNGDVLNIKRGKVFAEENRLTVVLTNDERLELELPTYEMPKVEKNAAGYYVKPNMDLIDLFIGSEGTLGVISEVEVRLVEKPQTILPIFAHFSEERSAIDFSKKLRALAIIGDLRIFSIEFFCKNSTQFVRNKYPPPKIPDGSNGIIFFEQEVPGEEDLPHTFEQTMSLLEQFNVLETMASFEPDWEKEAKEIRHALPEGINSFVRLHGTHKVATDIIVKEEDFVDMMKFYHEVGDRTRIPYVIFGHIGNNHVHFNFLPTNREELERAVKACTIFLKKAVELGGSISGEHGVGKKRYVEDSKEGPYLELMYGQKGLMEIARLKLALDRNRILNLGNIIPAEYMEQIQQY